VFWLELVFRDRVRVKVRVSFRLATFMYSVWPPVSVKVRVSLGIELELRLGSVLDSRHFHVLYGFLCPLGLGLELRSVWLCGFLCPLGLGLELRSGSVFDSPLSCILYGLLYPIFLTPNPRNFSVPF